MLLGDDVDESGSSPHRIIYVNDKVKNELPKFLHNRITTGKYNYFTFLPKFLFEQFSKMANMFFLFVAIIQVCFVLVE